MIDHCYPSASEAPNTDNPGALPAAAIARVQNPIPEQYESPHKSAGSPIHSEIERSQMPPHGLKALLDEHQWELIAYVDHRFRGFCWNGEDVVSCVFSRIARGINWPPKTGSVRGGLFRQTRNLAIDWAKKERTRKHAYKVSLDCGQTGGDTILGCSNPEVYGARHLLAEIREWCRSHLDPNELDVVEAMLDFGDKPTARDIREQLDGAGTPSEVDLAADKRIRRIRAKIGAVIESGLGDLSDPAEQLLNPSIAR